jgi:hypothetical protein
VSDIVIGVVGDARRQEAAWDLFKQTDATFISLDTGTLGCTKNHLMVWTNILQHGGDWGVVLEDDAELCEGFHDQLTQVLYDPPADVVSLYLGTGYPKAWQRFIKKGMATDAQWLLSTHVLHCVGLAIRMHLVPDMLRFVGKMTDTEKLWPVDEQITHWCRLRGQRVAHTKPSIVDHREDLPSLIEHPDGAGRTLPRHAWEFGRRDSWDSTATTEIP